MSASCRAAPTAAWIPAPPEATEMVPDEVTVTPWFAPALSLPVDTASMPRWVVVLADVMAPAWVMVTAPAEPECETEMPRWSVAMDVLAVVETVTGPAPG